MFVRRGDYCFRGEREIERQGKKREDVKGQRESEKDKGRKRRGKRASSIITSFHLDVLDVRTAEESPTVKSFDGFFGADCSIDEFRVADTRPRSGSIVACERFGGIDRVYEGTSLLTAWKRGNMIVEQGCNYRDTRDCAKSKERMD